MHRIYVAALQMGILLTHKIARYYGENFLKAQLLHNSFFCAFIQHIM